MRIILSSIKKKWLKCLTFVRAAEKVHQQKNTEFVANNDSSSSCSSSAVELRKRGPKVDLDFQIEVWNSILLVIYEKDASSSGQTNLKIKANVVYTYEIIRYAAKEVQAKLCWLDDEKIQALQFPILEEISGRQSLKKVKLDALSGLAAFQKLKEAMISSCIMKASELVDRQLSHFQWCLQKM